MTPDIFYLMVLCLVLLGFASVLSHSVGRVSALERWRERIMMRESFAITGILADLEKAIRDSASNDEIYAIIQRIRDIVAW